MDKFRSTTLKLTFFYVLSTAVILLVSSLAILVIFTPQNNYESFIFDSEHVEEEYDHDDWSLYEVRENLPTVLLVVDLFILTIVSIVSYFFARQTLYPIKEMYDKQQKFMSDVAHELRTPLSVMCAGAEATLRKDRTTAEYQNFVRDVIEEGGRLTRLTNQLLQMLRLGQVDKMVFSKENLSKLLPTLVENFTPYAAKHTVSMEYDVAPDIFVETEKDSLTEIIQNILKNATDYNRPGGVVKVSLSDMGGEVLILIADTGIGIPKDKNKEVFERFVKVDSARTQTQVSGTGLGLAIVQNLVEKLGGKVSLTSEVNVGTTVSVTLPKVHS